MKYPLRLNMLAPQKRQYLRRMVLFIYGKNILEIILIAVAVCAVILLVGRWFLQDYFNDLTGQLVSISNERSVYNERIQRVNSTLADLVTIQKDYQPWSENLATIFATVPLGVVLERAELDRAARVYLLSGIADERTVLLQFQKNLKELSFVSRVDLPLSQLTEKEHVSFMITAVLK